LRKRWNAEGEFEGTFFNILVRSELLKSKLSLQANAYEKQETVLDDLTF